MNQRSLQIFKEVVEENSLSQAAAKLHISQPSISQAIALLEEELGQKLFIRRTSPLQLTFAGIRLLRYIEESYKLEEQLINDFISFSDESSGIIKLGISTNRASVLLPLLLPEYKKMFPKVNIEIHEMGSVYLENLVANKAVDFAFASTKRNNPDLNYISFKKENLYIIAGKGTSLAKTIKPGTKITIDKIMNDEFISVKKGHNIRSIQDQLFQENSISVPLFFETESIKVAKEIAISCDKVTLFPELIMTKINEDKRACIYPLEHPQKTQEFCLCYRKDFPLKKYSKAFIDLSVQKLLK